MTGTGKIGQMRSKEHFREIEAQSFNTGTGILNKTALIGFYDQASGCLSQQLLQDLSMLKRKTPEHRYAPLICDIPP